MKSYYAWYKAKPGCWLVGAVKESRTSRFQHREEAELRLSTIRRLNGGALGEFEIVVSRRAPEIFTHCPESPSQAIGGRCFHCGKVLTAEDAKDTGRKVLEVTVEPGKKPIAMECLTNRDPSAEFDQGTDETTFRIATDLPQDLIRRSWAVVGVAKYRGKWR